MSVENGPLRSIEDIAKIAGVSKSTVSRALNDSPMISDATKKQIREIARRHDFRPSAQARRLSTRSSNTIAFVTHAYHGDFSVADLFTLEIMGGITAGLSELQYDLLVVQVDPRETDWAAQYLNTARVDGFILMTSSRKRWHVEHLLKMGAPFVAWGHGQGRYCSVCGDDVRGGRLATELLVSEGRRHIAFMGGPRIELEVQLRQRGYQEALADAGLSMEPSLVAYGDFSDRSGALAMKEILSRGGEVDAVFVNSDLMAISAMTCLREQGIRVPDDISVVGYDNLSIAGYASPPLTTVNQNIPLAGKYLARDLVRYLEHRIITESVVPVELIRRESA